jgi:nicotinate-nucleotide pyrophosphorylase (carboxylating)
VLLFLSRTQYTMSRMNKHAIIQKHFQKIDQLTTTNPVYRRCVDNLCEWVLKNDQVQRDLTTKLLFPKTPDEINARIISKQALTVAGIEEVLYLLDTFTDIHTTVKAKDGSQIGANKTILELHGSPSEVLAYERTVLNILQRLSGVATGTHAIVDEIKSLTTEHPPHVVSTRKTQWSLLDKKAVALGGGATHRLSLSDGVLVKDNHLLLLKDQYGLTSEPELVVKTIEILSQQMEDMLIEIEVEKRESIEALIMANAKLKSTNTLCILLDNFSPKDVKTILADLHKKYDLSKVLFEASGGITSRNIEDWATTGVDVLSLGVLTHSTKAVDLSLEII